VPAITQKGRKLASKLNPAIGTTRGIEETCSLIARHATTYQAYSETACNRELSEWEYERMEWLERRITRLIEDLPETDAGSFGPFFQGDPRGLTVGITAPGEWESLYDGWGRDRVLVEV
jgi:hypothetical protein